MTFWAQYKRRKMIDMTTQQDFNRAADGLEIANRAMEDRIIAAAPICHFRKMFRDQSDSTDGYYEQWWECSICGHTKALS